MTNYREPYYDGSSGSPSVSLVTYYRPGKGCYEFRVTRIYSTFGNLWDNSGKMELALYKWGKEVDSEGVSVYKPKKLKSLVYTSESSYINYMVALFSF